MGKKSFVTLSIGKNYYKIDLEDMLAVHRVTKKKRPLLPSY